MRLHYDKWTLLTVLLTWIVVSGVILSHLNSMTLQGLTLASQLGFLIGPLVILNEYSKAGVSFTKLISLTFSAVCICILFYLTPHDIALIYSVIFTSILTYHVGIYSVVIITGLLLISFAIIKTIVWQYDEVIRSVLLWSMFHLFAIMVSLSEKKAKQATDKADRAQQELLAAQALIQQTSKHNERLRIARELHDAIGHQLTALAIQLDVAKRKSHRENSSDLCILHNQTKNLLSEIRSVVSEYRYSGPLNITQALHSLCSNTPLIKCRLNIEENLTIEAPEICHTILRCSQEALSNTLKHSQSSELTFKLYKDHGEYRLCISDKTPLKKQIVWGNGLLGIKERVEGIGGRFKPIIEPDQPLQLVCIFPQRLMDISEVNSKKVGNHS